MSPSLNIFVTGATGYIGGAVVDRLLTQPNSKTFNITALVRSREKAHKLESLGVKTVLGSYSDFDKLEASAAEADLVFTAADCDDERANEAILRGIKKRYEATGSRPILIHTSGTGVLVDDALGMYASETIYSDTDVAQIESLPATQVHRPVDLAIVAADQAGYVKTYIVLPSNIYGVAKGRLVDLGVQNPHSILLPLSIKFALNRGNSFVVGEGKNLWPNVDIEDLTDLYIILFDAILEGKNPAHGREGFYFGENGEYSQYQVSKALATALYELGLIKSDEPTRLTEEEIQQSPLVVVLAGNSRCRADRSRALGWKPTKTTDDFLASIKPEVLALGYATTN